MMSKVQYLLTKIAEESSEVAQIALKTQQFGVSEEMPNQPFTNLERFLQEWTDLNAVVAMLGDELLTDFSLRSRDIANKREKVEHYMEYSQSLGLVAADE